ncbi:MAG: hypothetical protein KBT88_06050 [Gammaproteobacteria bacterium]|nr:hypothetical protein [Gammaproteobacteria bacterium]MBQ0839331.1 hypothetical protein [Gammaproteobacteria bacterium]
MLFFNRMVVVCLSAGFIASAVSAESALNDRYKQSYISQVTPMIEQQLLAANGGIAKADLKSEASVWAEKMASCQLEAIEHYPSNYREASVKPVANGGDIVKVTNDVNQLMKSDFEAGSLSLTSLQQLVATAAQKFKKCMG